jgi:predicted nucleic acid-binding protein
MNLIDTDIILELLHERRHEMGAISVITLIEILRGLEDGKRVRVKDLLEKSFSVQSLSNETIITYCSLYRRLKKEGVLIPDADLLIAATAISKNMMLKTHDQHFTGLVKLGLKLTKASKK